MMIFEIYLELILLKFFQKYFILKSINFWIILDYGSSEEEEEVVEVRKGRKKRGESDSGSDVS